MQPDHDAIAAIRFGTGLSPRIAPPSSPGMMLARLAGPDQAAQRWPIAPFRQRVEEEVALGRLRKARRKGEAGAEEVFRKAHARARGQMLREMRIAFVRAAFAEDAFRERLLRFWADHFTVSAKGKRLPFVTSAYVEEAIRPHLAGRFGDMLQAVETHPVMLTYLDQTKSTGPNSPIGRKMKRGLNENLAREILELHTLGVGGSYTQTDVRQFAELLTGLTFNFRTGFRFRADMAEPGAETVLGRSYGGDDPAGLDDIRAVLADLAVHPDTARHLARKLAVHFVSDDPDPGLVAALEAAWRDTGGDLMAVYTALLDHPAAWEPTLEKARQPFDFMAAAFRALDPPPERILDMDRRETRVVFVAALRAMGQPWQQPPGPDGWPEEIDDWITPQGLAARIEWALLIANRLGGERDPAAFARTALGPYATDRLTRLVSFAESREEGLALVMAAPAFNRR